MYLDINKSLIGFLDSLIMRSIGKISDVSWDTSLAFHLEDKLGLIILKASKICIQYF